MNLSTLEPQTGKLGRIFINVKVCKNLQVPTIFKNGQTSWHWLHFFKYCDDNSYFGLEYDYNGVLIRKLTHKECLSI